MLKDASNLEVQYLPLNLLIPYAKNSRTHSDEQISQIAASIKEFGFTNPILIDAEGGIIAGHGRALAAHRLKMGQVPTICLGHLSETQRRAYVIADNRLALNAGWDTKMLSLEMIELKAEEFDLELLGFDSDELESLLNPEVEPEQGNGDPDEVPEQAETRCKPGDLWILGKHRLLCGDSTNVQHVERLMGGEKADLVYTDPPYGIDEETNRVEHVKTFKKQGVAKKGNYSKIAGDTTIQTAVDVWRLLDALGCQKIIYWGGNYYAGEFPNSPCWIVWDKREEDKHRDLNSDCELAYVKHPHKASVRIFRHLWKGMIKASERGEARCHPTQKPVALAEWCIGEYDPDGSTVLDLFLGSGSTLIACEKTGRRCFGMELDPKYCSVIIERWCKFTGKMAYRLDDDGTQTPWNEIAAEGGQP